MSTVIDFADGLTLSLPVSNLEKSITWYKEVLGFSLLYKMDELGWCEMQSPVADVNVGLSVVEHPTPGGATPTFGVRDIAAAKSALEAANVRIDGDVVTITDMVQLLTFYDPDDNSLMFFQNLAGSE
ncbi:MAG: VOC family protein [Planctomycetaceae bacterium]|nr:VOC family protein [Planctomycetaceae bacterium]